MSKLSSVTTAASSAIFGRLVASRNASVVLGFGNALAMVKHEDPRTAAEQTTPKTSPAITSFPNGPTITIVPVKGSGDLSFVRKGSVAQSFGYALPTQSVKTTAAPAASEFSPSGYSSEDSLDGRRSDDRLSVDGRQDGTSQGDSASASPTTVPPLPVGPVVIQVVSQTAAGVAAAVQSSVAGGQALTVPGPALPVFAPDNTDGLAARTASLTIGAKSPTLVPAPSLVPAIDARPSSAADDAQSDKLPGLASKVIPASEPPAIDAARILPFAAGAFSSAMSKVLDPVSTRQQNEARTEVSKSFDHLSSDLALDSSLGLVAADPTSSLISSVPLQSTPLNGSGLPSTTQNDVVTSLVGSLLSRSKVVTPSKDVPVNNAVPSNADAGAQPALPSVKTASSGAVAPIELIVEQRAPTGILQRFPGLAPLGASIEGVIPTKGASKAGVTSLAAGPAGVAVDPSQEQIPMIGSSDATTGRTTSGTANDQPTVDAIDAAPAGDRGNPVAASTQSVVGHADPGYSPSEGGVQKDNVQADRSQQSIGPSGDAQGGNLQLGIGIAVPSFAAPISGVSVGVSPPAGSMIASAVRDQVATAAAAMVQGHGSIGRFSVSINPDELGHISITMERGKDGTTTIHIAAEQLATLDILRTDQRDLLRALDQSGLGRNQHTLSFSWNGSGSGGASEWAGQGWGARDDGRGDPSPSNSAQSYAQSPIVVPTITSQARGSVDVTA